MHSGTTVVHTEHLCSFLSCCITTITEQVLHRKTCRFPLMWTTLHPVASSWSHRTTEQPAPWLSPVRWRDCRDHWPTTGPLTALEDALHRERQPNRWRSWPCSPLTLVSIPAQWQMQADRQGTLQLRHELLVCEAKIVYNTCCLFVCRRNMRQRFSTNKKRFDRRNLHSWLGL